MAAKKLGRHFIGIEIEEKYLELAVKRIMRQQVAVQEELREFKTKKVKQMSLFKYSKDTAEAIS